MKVINKSDIHIYGRICNGWCYSFTPYCRKEYVFKNLITILFIHMFSVPLYKLLQMAVGGSVCMDFGLLINFSEKASS